MKSITNETLLERLDNLIKTNEKAHIELIIQTTKTNGSVAQVFKEIAENKEKTTKEITVLQNWQSKWIGASIVISSIIIPVLLYLLYLHIHP